MVAGSGSKIQDFVMILLAMFGNSVMDVGAKFVSWQDSDEVSRDLKKSGISRCTKITSDIDNFLLEKVDKVMGEINSRRAGGEGFICFPVKKASNCLKQGFAATFSWVYEASIIIQFWFEDGILYNTVLVSIRLIVGRELGTAPSPFKPTTDHLLLLDFLTVPRGTRPNSDDMYGCYILFEWNLIWKCSSESSTIDFNVKDTI